MSRAVPALAKALALGAGTGPVADGSRRVPEVVAAAGISDLPPGRHATLVNMSSASVRRILAIKPRGPWLVLVEGVDRP
jgi:hypothetical protein